MYNIFEQLLQKFGVTSYQVSKATGIGQSTLSSWKTRRNILSTDKLQKIADYFGVSLDYLMGNSYIEDMGPIIKEERERLRLSREDIAEQAGISVHSLEGYETLDEPIREDILDAIADALGTSVLELMYDYGMYDEQIPDYFEGDVVKYEKFKKVQDEEAKKECALYYINKDAKELAQFLFENPEYKVLFDASRKVKKEDIDFVKQMLDRMRNDPDDTGC